MELKEDEEKKKLRLAESQEASVGHSVTNR